MYIARSWDARIVNKNVTELLMISHSVCLTSLIHWRCMLSTFLLAEYNQNVDVR
jgi:hypothetical protein